METYLKMVRLLGFFAILFFFLVSSSAEDVFELPPRPYGPLADFANVIPEEYRIKMTNIAHEVLRSSGTSIVVVTFKTIGQNDINDFANRLFEAWGIGKKGEDRGVLILLAIKERKIRIETGYGLEHLLPDGLVGEILDSYAIPHLRKGDYGQGLYSVVVAIASVLEKEKNTRPSEIHKGRKKGVGLFLLLPLLLILILFILSQFPARRQYRRRSIPLYFASGYFGRNWSFGPFGGGFGGFGGGMSGGGGATRGF